MRRWGLLCVTGLLAGLVLASAASGSQLVDRNAKNVTLQLNDKGEALLTYTVRGRVRHVLAWGAINALPPRSHVPQVALTLDYAGGYGKYFAGNHAAQRLTAAWRHNSSDPTLTTKVRAAQTYADTYWRTSFHGGCGRYDGPPLAWATITCKAPDGSYWAVQQWQRELPDYGVAPSALSNVWELRLSHWTGALPVLAVHMDWSFRKYDHLWGTFTYLGQPVFGFHSTSVGNPLDHYGRNVYIDTFDSVYGSGWRRENSALTHLRTGVFCYSFNEHPGHPSGAGRRYRITVIGPGVTPDVSWLGASRGPYDATADALANEQIAGLGDSACHPN